MLKKKTTNLSNQNRQEHEPINVLEYLLTNYRTILDEKLQETGIDKVERDRLVEEDVHLLRISLKKSSLLGKLQKLANEHHRKQFPKVQ